MTIINQLFPASFRGVSFYVMDSNMESGRKQVTHEFPNSNRRYVEDLGRFQNIYKMTALITGNGYAYIQQRNALQQALEQPGIGQLVHPFYGTLQVVPKQYSVQEGILTLGEAIFSLTFERSDTPLVPQGDNSNLSKIALLVTALLAAFSGNIASGFSLFGGYPNNYLSAQNIIAAIGNAFGINTTIFTQNSGSINQYNALLNQYQTGVNTMIANPTLLGSQTIGLFSGIDDLISDPAARLNVYSGFYNFYNNVPPVAPTTFELLQRQNNINLLAGTIQAAALVQSYQAASLINYTNIDQLNAVQSQLEAQYQAVVNNGSLSSDLEYQILNLRNEMRIFFQNEALNVNNIVSVTTNTQPITTLVYQYYGNLDNVDTIAGLNSIGSSAFIEGLVDILSV